MLCEHSVCLADKPMEVRRNKEIISESLERRKLAGIVYFHLLFLPNSRSA